MANRIWLLVLLLMGADPRIAAAGGGLFGIDHEWSLDDRGIWARKYQMALEYGVVGFEAGGALWLGDDSRLGHTLWQSADASLLSAIDRKSVV